MVILYFQIISVNIFLCWWIWLIFEVKLWFIPYKAEQSPRGMEVQEKEARKD